MDFVKQVENSIVGFEYYNDSRYLDEIVFFMLVKWIFMDCNIWHSKINHVGLEAKKMKNQDLKKKITTQEQLRNL